MKAIGGVGIREYVRHVIRQTEGRCGWAVGSGNSIPNSVSAAGYLAMVKTVRERRGCWRGRAVLHIACGGQQQTGTDGP